MGKQYHGQVQLPSKGILYEGELRDLEGILNVSPWDTSDEELLISSIPFYDKMDKLVRRCTDCPLPPEELLLVDRWHLFIYMRCLSLGGDYSFEYRCQAPDCSSQEIHSMDLENDLDVVYADDTDMLVELEATELKEPFRFKLPLLEKEVGWRMLRGKDERAADKHVLQLRKRGKRDGGHQYRLARRIVEIEGKEVTMVDAIDLVRDLKGKDSLQFRNEIEAVRLGIKDDISVRCTACGWENEVSMPLDKSFFRPRRST